MSLPDQRKELVQQDAWSSLRAFTKARIAQGRTGAALPLKEVLALKLAHAHARDAVYASLDISFLAERLSSLFRPVVSVRSQAESRLQYLQDPGLGRKLDPGCLSVEGLEPSSGGIVIVVADGLSATAVQQHAFPLLEYLIPALKKTAPVKAIALASQGRVALGDEIGGLLNADMLVMLIGERPGLTAADSLGAYLTYQPRPGLTDESRNCVSNIHAGGLAYETAAKRISRLVALSFDRRLSGTVLKDEGEDRLPGY